MCVSAGDGVASWVGMDGTGAPQPQWRYPTESDFKCARHIASTVAAAAAAEVEQLASAGLIASTASSPRHKLYRALKYAPSRPTWLLYSWHISLLLTFLECSRCDTCHDSSHCCLTISLCWACYSLDHDYLPSSQK